MKIEGGRLGPMINFFLLILFGRLFIPNGTEPVPMPGFIILSR